MCTGCDVRKRPQEGPPYVLEIIYWLVEVGFGKKMCTVHTVHTAQAVTHLRVTCGNAPRGGLVQVHCHLPLAKRKFNIFTRSKKGRKARIYHLLSKTRRNFTRNTTLSLSRVHNQTRIVCGCLGVSQPCIFICSSFLHMVKKEKGAGKPKGQVYLRTMQDFPYFPIFFLRQLN